MAGQSWMVDAVRVLYELASNVKWVIVAFSQDQYSTSATNVHEEDGGVY